MISLAASYSSRSSISDVGFAILFGVIGYGMRRTNFSAAAFIIAFVLTTSMETAFRQSMIISDNGLLVFLQFEYMNKFSYAPIFLIIGVLVVGFRAYSTISKSKRTQAWEPSLSPQIFKVLSKRVMLERCKCGSFLHWRQKLQIIWIKQNLEMKIWYQNLSRHLFTLQQSQPNL